MGMCAGGEARLRLSVGPDMVKTVLNLARSGYCEFRISLPRRRALK